MVLMSTNEFGMACASELTGLERMAKKRMHAFSKTCIRNLKGLVISLNNERLVQTGNRRSVSEIKFEIINAGRKNCFMI